MKKHLASFVLSLSLLAAAFTSGGVAHAAASDPNASAVVKKSVNLRTSPSTSGHVIRLLRSGTPLVVLENPNRYWTKVSAAGTVGYVSPSYITATAAPKPVVTPAPAAPAPAKPIEAPKPTPAPAAPSSAAWEQKADAVIAYGKTFLGRPYVFGANGPSSFDCSGFTTYIFKKYGITMHRGSRDMIRDGVPVAKSDVRKGDLILSDTNHDGVINHVSVYIGNGQLLHTYRPGIGVTISTWSGSAWDRGFIAARRIIQ